MKLKTYYWFFVIKNLRIIEFAAHHRVSMRIEEYKQQYGLSF